MIEQGPGLAISTRQGHPRRSRTRARVRPEERRGAARGEGRGDGHIRGTEGVPRKGVWTSVNMRVRTCKDLPSKRNQTSCYTRPPFLGTPLGFLQREGRGRDADGREGSSRELGDKARRAGSAPA